MKPLDWDAKLREASWLFDFLIYQNIFISNRLSISYLVFKKQNEP